MDPEQMLITMRALDRIREEQEIKRNFKEPIQEPNSSQVKEEQEIKRRAYENGEKFKVKKRGLGKNAVKKSLIILVIGFFFGPITLRISLILSIIAVPLIFIYYYGIKKQLYKEKVKNRHFKCPHCENMYKGYQKICPYCRGKLKYDIIEYKCGYCGHKFTTHKNKCPNCGVELYYK